MKPRYWQSLLALVFVSDISNAAQQSDYEKWKTEHLKQYESFSTAYLKRYQDFKNQVEKRWGTGSELSDQDSYIVYSEDLSQKTVVDFSNQEIRIEVLADENNLSDLQLQQQAVKLVSQPVNTLAAADPLLQGVQHPETRPLAQALLPDLPVGASIPTDKISIEEVTVIAPAVTATNTGSEIKDTSPVASPAPVDKPVDPTNKRVKRITIHLDGKNLYQQRAMLYQTEVSEQARIYELDKALLLAIMQVESSFNPLAQSPVPAFGLMQIVPESAGKDVNNRVFKRQSPPDAEQLFKPDENIQFGSAYINILQGTYLSGIKDPTSRLYCAIAAYNTGAGNVARVFHPRGAKRINEAVAVINTLDPDEVYQRLIAQLPYEETRKYLQKVISAMPQYQL